jgi:two-component system, cell cycle sensor histidine kinase and response regulator CckA
MDILVIDDNEFILEAVSAMLKNRKYNVLTASDGFCGISKYQENWMNINLVFLDMKMPKISGFQVFYELKKINKDVKVIIISGYANQREVEILQEEGCPFLKKPFTIEELDTIVNSSI